MTFYGKEFLKIRECGTLRKRTLNYLKKNDFFFFVSYHFGFYHHYYNFLVVLAIDIVNSWAKRFEFKIVKYLRVAISHPSCPHSVHLLFPTRTLAWARFLGSVFHNMLVVQSPSRHFSNTGGCRLIISCWMLSTPVSCRTLTGNIIYISLMNKFSLHARFPIFFQIKGLFFYMYLYHNQFFGMTPVCLWWYVQYGFCSFLILKELNRAHTRSWAYQPHRLCANLSAIWRGQAQISSSEICKS